jgi:hypothetical protein
MKTRQEKIKIKRFRFNIVMNPFVLIAIIAAICMIVWITIFNMLRMRELLHH